MKKISLWRSLLILAVGFSLTACNDKPGEEPEAPSLSVEPTTNIVFSADGKTAEANGQAIVPEFEVKTNQTTWDAVVTPSDSWCTLKKEGNKFTLSASENNNTESPAPASVKVTAGDATPVTINVTQKGKTVVPDQPTLNITPDSGAFRMDIDLYICPDNGDWIKPVIKVETNQDTWTHSRKTDGDEWLKAVKRNPKELEFSIDFTKFTNVKPVTVTLTAGDAEPVEFVVTFDTAVHIVGTLDGTVAKYWQNGTETNLPIGGTGKAVANSVSRFMGNVYVGGYDNDNRSVLWTNGVADTKTYSEATDVIGVNRNEKNLAVYGNVGTSAVIFWLDDYQSAAANMYPAYTMDFDNTGGSYILGYLPSIKTYRAFVFGNVRTLGKTTDENPFHLHYVSGYREGNYGTIYYAGYTGTGDDLRAVYWVNNLNSAVELSTKPSEAFVTIADDSGTPYFGGYEVIDGRKIPAVWKNEQRVQLESAAGSDACVKALHVFVDGTIHAAGEEKIGEGATAVYRVIHWVDGKRNVIAESTGKPYTVKDLLVK